LLNKALEISSSNFDINGGSRGSDITIYDCALNDIINFYGVDAVLAEIGRDKAKEYFDLQEKE
jgi:hypothetical protein